MKKLLAAALCSLPLLSLAAEGDTKGDAMKSDTMKSDTMKGGETSHPKTGKARHAAKKTKKKGAGGMHDSMKHGGTGMEQGSGTK